MSRHRQKAKAPEMSAKEMAIAQKRQDTRPDWTHCCSVCGVSPVVPATGMCGPCTFGEADTAGGGW